METVSASGPFNGTLETGIRLVFILHAFYPTAVDINKLTYLDYLVVRTSLLDGGPPDLHPPTPIIPPVTQVRRKFVQAAVSLMMTRNLVEQVVEPGGIYYLAGDNSEFFVNAVQTSYLLQLSQCARWLADYFRDYSDEGFEALMGGLLKNWVAEFQDEMPGSA